MLKSIEEIKTKRAVQLYPNPHIKNEEKEASPRVENLKTEE